ncbi:GNAT family N-acetyltransferase [Streptomyces sp. NPDC046203]|uniref:GNAT family N-acetyltransferase n=1 Tax=Streptomyces sp. NPDC046203 TaxID=3154602 RepID=UPI0033EBEDEF
MIVLRSLGDADAPALRRVYSGASMPYLARSAMTLPDAERFVRRARRWAMEVPVARYVLGAEHGRTLVGVVKLDRRPEAHGRVSYVFREDLWGRGHATDAVRELVSFAFTAAGFRSLGARHHPGNPASGRVLLKNGFLRLGLRDGLIEYRLEARAA